MDMNVCSQALTVSITVTLNSASKRAYFGASILMMKQIYAHRSLRLKKYNAKKRRQTNQPVREEPKTANIHGWYFETASWRSGSPHKA